MLEGLRTKEQLKVKRGVAGKVFPLFKTAIRDRPDFIHLDWLHQYYFRASRLLTWISFPVFVIDVLLAKRVMGAKFVWTLHNIHPHAGPDYGPYRWPRQFFARHCEWIRVFSKSTVDRAATKLLVSPKKFIVIPEGSYLSYYPDEVDRTSARRRFQLENSEKVLLFLGSIKPYKGIEDLITAFRELHKKTRVKLIIAGATLDTAYAKMIQEQVTASESISFFPGLVEVEEIQYYMKAADLVVLPFKKIENSGTAILAMGFGKVVVAPAQGVLPYRLSAQLQLLYQEELLVGLLSAINIPHKELLNIGRNNKENLEKHKWSDFTKAF